MAPAGKIVKERFADLFLPSGGWHLSFRRTPNLGRSGQCAGSIPYHHERQRNQPERISTPRRRHRQRPLPSGFAHPADPPPHRALEYPQQGFLVPPRTSQIGLAAPETPRLYQGQIRRALQADHPKFGSPPLTPSPQRRHEGFPRGGSANRHDRCIIQPVPPDGPPACLCKHRDLSEIHRNERLSGILPRRLNALTTRSRRRKTRQTS